MKPLSWYLPFFSLKGKDNKGAVNPIIWRQIPPLILIGEQGLEIWRENILPDSIIHKGR